MARDPGLHRGDEEDGDLLSCDVVQASAMQPLLLLAREASRIASPGGLLRIGGRVKEISPAICRVRGLSRFAMLGDVVEIESSNAHETIGGQVVQLSPRGVLVKTFASEPDIRLGAFVWLKGPLRLSPCTAWKGRIVNALGEPVDGRGPLPQGEAALPVDRAAPAAMHRARITRAVRTGVKVVDLFTPVCAGQRIGVFAGSGVGKSTFLSMLAHAAGFDTVVFALIGERGREVREFIEDAIGLHHLARTVGVIATGDESPMMRRLALKTAMTIAEYFRDAGENVLFIADSITRHAHAARDVLLAAGEAPVARGYPPGVFTELPRILERAGPGIEGTGSITAFVSVLVDGDDHNDPVADAIRGILDGHIVLSRSIAEQGRLPAVDVLASVSRLAHLARTPDQEKLATMLRRLIARYEDTRDLRLLGGYKPGMDEELDRAVAWVPKIYEVLQQSPQDPPVDDPWAALAEALREASEAPNLATHAG